MHWITEAPCQHALVCPDALTFGEELNCLRISRLLDNDVVAAYLDRNVIADIGQVSTIIPHICKAYAVRFPERHLKAFVYIDSDIDYTVPNISGVKYCHHIRSGEKTPIITYLSADMAQKAVYFGSAVIFFLVKRGKIIDYSNVEMLQALGRTMRERFFTVIILTDTQSTALEVNRVAKIFSGRDRTFVYDEITF